MGNGGSVSSCHCGSSAFCVGFSQSLWKPQSGARNSSAEGNAQPRPSPWARATGGMQPGAVRGEFTPTSACQSLKQPPSKRLVFWAGSIRSNMMESPSTQVPKGTSCTPRHPTWRGVAAGDSNSAPRCSCAPCSAPRTPSLVIPTPFPIRVWAALPSCGQELCKTEWEQTRGYFWGSADAAEVNLNPQLKSYTLG